MAVLVALVLTGCGGSGSGAPTGSMSAEATGAVRIHAWLEGGPLDPKTRRAMFDHRPVRNVRIVVTSRAGRHWHGRTTAAGTRTFQLPPGRYVITSHWCGTRRAHIRVLSQRVVPLRYACPVP